MKRVRETANDSVQFGLRENGRRRDVGALPGRSQDQEPAPPPAGSGPGGADLLAASSLAVSLYRPLMEEEGEGPQRGIKFAESQLQHCRAESRKEGLELRSGSVTSTVIIRRTIRVYPL